MHNVTLTCQQAHAIDKALWELMGVYDERIRSAEANGIENNALIGYWKREKDRLYQTIIGTQIECGHTWEEQEQIDSVRHLLG